MSVGFREEGSQPVIATIRYERGESHLEMQRVARDRARLATSVGETVIEEPFDDALTVLDVPHRYEAETDDERRVLAYVQDFARNWWGGNGRRQRLSPLVTPSLTAVAPLRAKPRRTYDPGKETTSPEGIHVPMLMMRLHRSNKNRWGKLHDDLVAFGGSPGCSPTSRSKPMADR